MSQQLELLTENPSQWSAVIHLTPEIQKKQIKPFVALALKELEGSPDSRLASLMHADKYAAVRAVVSHVARQRSATKEPWSLEDVTSFLEGLRLGAECVAELARLVCAEQVYAPLPTQRRVKPALARLHWKIDLSLSQSRLAGEGAGAAAEGAEAAGERRRDMLRQLACIIVTVALSDHTTHTYRLSVSKFHELRFVVASALKSMIVLERRKCLRRD